MNRFFVEKNMITDKEIRITDPRDIHHLARVLRVGLGEDIFVTDGMGSSYIGTVGRISKDAVVLTIKERLKKSGRDERQAEISLAVAVPQNARFEDVVDKAAQLEVDEIIPLFTERTQVKQEAFAKKRGRLQRVLLAAARQSGILFLPRLKDGMRFRDLVRTVSAYDLCLLPNLSERSLSLKRAIASLRSRKKGPLKILVLVGPEGDFTPAEVALALKAGCQGVSLGLSVLRVDTAAIAVLSFLRLYLEP